MVDQYVLKSVRNYLKTVQTEEIAVRFGIIFGSHATGRSDRWGDVNAKTHKQLTEAGKILGLRILDHIIVTKKGYFSFQEAGLIG